MSKTKIIWSKNHYNKIKPSQIDKEEKQLKNSVRDTNSKVKKLENELLKIRKKQKELELVKKQYKRINSLSGVIFYKDGNYYKGRIKFMDKTYTYHIGSTELFKKISKKKMKMMVLDRWEKKLGIK